MRSSSLAFGALAGVLALIGCGSPAKEKDYRREANAVCAAAAKRLDELPRPSSLAEVAKVSEREIAIRKQLVAELGELVPPIEIAGGANNVYEDQEAREQHAHALEKAAEDKDRRKVRELRREARSEHPFEVWRARALGLGDCAEL